MCNMLMCMGYRFAIMGVWYKKTLPDAGELKEEFCLLFELCWLVKGWGYLFICEVFWRRVAMVLMPRRWREIAKCSLGEWIASDSRPKPMRRESMPRVCLMSATMGMVAPSRMRAGRLPAAFSIAV